MNWGVWFLWSVMEASSVLHLLMRIFHQVPKANEWCSLRSSSDLKGKFQMPETTCDLLYTLMSHQPTFPLHNKRVWGGCPANALCRWIPELHFASKVWLTWVCVSTPSWHICLNPAAGAKGMLKGALRLRRSVVDEQQQVPGKIKKKIKKTKEERRKKQQHPWIFDGSTFCSATKAASTARLAWTGRKPQITPLTN